MKAILPTEYLNLGASHILYDPSRIEDMREDLFEPETWRTCGQLQGGAPGRGTTVFVSDAEGGLALRHYRRGGMVARLVSDCYLWLGLARSRPWREYLLLATLFGMGLPVPRPVAARCVRAGLCYRADLITERLPGQTLAAVLAAGPLPTAQLQAVGACIRRFHHARVYHADLNARNILLGEGGEVTLLDFDQSGFRHRSEGWQQQNLTRLRRSLEKFRRQQAGFVYDEAVWQAIMAGYQED